MVPSVMMSGQIKQHLLYAGNLAFLHMVRTYIFAIECATVRILTIDLDSVYTYFECIVF